MAPRPSSPTISYRPALVIVVIASSRATASGSSFVNTTLAGEFSRPQRATLRGKKILRPLERAVRKDPSWQHTPSPVRTVVAGEEAGQRNEGTSVLESISGRTDRGEPSTLRARRNSRLVNPCVIGSPVIVSIATGQQDASVFQQSFCHEVPGSIEMASDGFKRAGCGIEQLDQRASAGNDKLPGRELNRLFGKFEAARGEAGCRRELSCGWLEDLGGRKITIPIALIRAAGYQDSAVRKKAGSVLVTG